MRSEVGVETATSHLLDRLYHEYGFTPNATPYGSDLLLLWTESDTSTRYAPMDSSGRFLAKPTLVPESIGRRNDLVQFPNGHVGRLTASRGATEVKLVRVRW